MKFKFLSLSLISLVGLTGYADEYTSGNLKFTTNTDGTASVSGVVGEPTEITIPQTITVDEKDYSVTTIAQSAFQDCTTLERITIPEFITSIGSYAFNGCSGLKYLDIEDSDVTLSLGYHTKKWAGGSSYNYNGMFADCPIDSVMVGRNLSYERTAYPLYSVPTIQFVRIGPKVTNFINGIGTKAKTIIIEDSETLLTAAQTNCYNLYLGRNISNETITTADSVYVGPMVTDLPLFYDGKQTTQVLKSIQFDPDVKISTLKQRAFCYCRHLKNFVIPRSVKTIEGYIFQACDSIEELTIPSNIQSIGYAIFYYNSSVVEVKPRLKKFIIEDSESPLNLYSTIFPSSSLGEVYIGRNLKTSHTESASLSHATITFGDYVTEICSGVNADGISTLRLPKSLVSIQDGAFSKSITIRTIYCGAEVPPTVVSFPNELYTTAKLVIPESAMEAYAKADVWKNFYYVEAFDPDSREIDKINYTLNKEVLDAKVTYQRKNNMSNYSGFVNVVIPESVDYLGVTYNVVGIGPEAFNYCWGLKSISLPQTITSIDELAFGYCTSLRSIEIPTAVTTIGAEAFTGCSALASVVFGDKVESIGDYAFFGCTGLSELHIPSSVTSVGDNAFMGVHWLNDVYAAATIPADAPATSFSATAYRNATLHVPNGTLPLYQAHPTWSKFLTIKDDVSTGVDDVMYSDEVRVKTIGGSIVFEGVEAGTIAQVYTASGKLVYNGSAEPVALQPGFYIVTLNGKAFKVSL